MYVCVCRRFSCTIIIVISVSSSVYQEDESSERFKRKIVEEDFAQRYAEKRMSRKNTKALRQSNKKNLQR